MHAYQSSQPPASSPSLPPGWVAATDPTSGRVYYANPTTGETQWTAPPPLPPPPQDVAPVTVNSPQPSARAPQASLITGPLVPRVRAILSSSGELCEELSPGTIADLCNVQQALQSENEEDQPEYYKPIEPDQLFLHAQPTSIEPGRLEIRLASLKSKLRDI